MIEQVTDRDSGAQRYRSSRELKKYLLEKRPKNNDGARITSYRTTSCLAINDAVKDGAPAEIVEFLNGELAWALGKLKILEPEVFRRFSL